MVSTFEQRWPLIQSNSCNYLYLAENKLFFVSFLALQFLLENRKNDRVSLISIQWNLVFSNPHFFEPSDNSNQKLFPLLSRTLQFYPRFLELSDFSNQFSFPFEVRKIETPLYIPQLVGLSKTSWRGLSVVWVTTKVIWEQNYLWKYNGPTYCQLNN